MTVPIASDIALDETTNPLEAASSEFLDLLVAAHPERARRLSVMLFPSALTPEAGDVPDLDFRPEDVPPPEIQRPPPVKIDPDRWANIGNAIVRLIADHCRVSMQELRSARRDRDLSHGRQIGYYLCKRYSRQSLPQIGRLFGGRDHTTIMHGLKVISALLETNAGVRDEIAKLSGLLIAAHPWLAEAVPA